MGIFTRKDPMKVEFFAVSFNYIHKLLIYYIIYDKDSIIFKLILKIVQIVF
jgi:hypothetical protein